MSILLRCLGAIAGLLLLLAAVGLFLPRRHVARRWVRIGRPPAEVFRAISDFPSWPAWYPGARRVELFEGPDGRRRCTLHGRFGPMTAVVEELEPPRLLRTRLEGETSFGGTWTYEVAPDGAGSRVTVTEDGVVGNPLFRTLARFVFGHARTIEGFLRALGSRFGEPVSPRE